MAVDLENSIQPEKTVVIPSYIQYPDIRIHIPAREVSTKGDRVKITINIIDKDGVEKNSYTQKIIFKELPVNKDIIGVVTASFIETEK